MDRDVADWDKMLAQTLEDNRLPSRNGRLLKERLRDAALDDRVEPSCAAASSRIAPPGSSNDVRTIPIVDWLEEVSKLLLPSAAAEGEPFVEAHFSPSAPPASVASAASSTAPAAAPTSAVFTITDNRIADGILAAHRRWRRRPHHHRRREGPRSRLRRPGSWRGRGPGAGGHNSPLPHAPQVRALRQRPAADRSYNWTRGAADSNEENMILSNDRRLLASFRCEFERL